MMSTFSNQVLATVALFQAYILILVLYSMNSGSQNTWRISEWHQALNNATSVAWAKYSSSALSTGTTKLAVQLPTEAPVPIDINSSKDLGSVAVDFAEVDDSKVDETGKEIHEKLSALPSLYGWQKKKAMLEPEKWLKKFRKERISQVLEWMSQPLEVRKTEGNFQPPAVPSGCTVVINHHYKFIWIKGKKVGGSSLRVNVGNICGSVFLPEPEPNMTYCASTPWKEASVDVEKVQGLWKDYVVFGFIRNPYTRFASSYKYIDSYLGGECKHPTFLETCKNIFAQAESAMNPVCGRRERVYHHIQHMVEATSCLFTRSGESVVDFIGRTEYLTEDYQELAREVNRRLGDSNLKLNETKPVGIVNSTTKKPNSEAEYIFQQYPECLKHVEDAFAIDFKTFGY